MSWLKLSLDASAAQLEATEQLLTELGAQALTVLPLDDQIPWEPSPGEQPIAPRNRVEALVPLSNDLEGLRSSLALSLPAEQMRSVDASFVADEDWQRRFEANAISAHFGERLWLVPKSAPIPDGPCVRLDPGLAFGTGAHPTTRLCLQALAVSKLSGARILDYGCGSGILAIAAIKLGASAATAVDYDPQALVATAENATYNGVSCITQDSSDAQIAAERTSTAQRSTNDHNETKDAAAMLQICLPEGLDPSQQFDVVVANILANPLIELAPRLQSAVGPGGQLMLAGLLSTQVEAVMAAYPEIRFQGLAPEHCEDDWRLLRGQRR
ncbi:MAG: 50S ribosomal protein L11 methyltransferase [Pseudomonadales bacterium]